MFGLKGFDLNALLFDNYYDLFSSLYGERVKIDLADSFIFFKLPVVNVFSL